MPREAPIVWELPKGARYQGRPCKYGHNGMRYAGTGICVECAKRHSKNQKFRKRLLRS